ncbi:MAG: hypothetical protein ACRD96_15225 [Bryobacteraceae bacterium]
MTKKEKGIKIPSLTVAQRRMNALKAVLAGSVPHGVSQHDLIAACRRTSREALTNVHSMPKLVETVWKLEGLAGSYARKRKPDATLADHRIPRECFPVVHGGFGAVCAELVHFDIRQLVGIVETLGEPHYQGFAYEAIGGMLRMYESGSFKMMCGMMGVIPIRAPDGPLKSGFYSTFIPFFPAAAQRPILHGYGRMVAVSTNSVAAALNDALDAPPMYLAPVVHGVGYAVGMMHSEEMARILEHSELDYQPTIRHAFQSGLLYAMLMCDWLAPAFLASWKATGALEHKLVEKARDEAARNQRRGRILAYQLEEPLA